MRAAEHERVDRGIALEQLREVSPRDEPRDVVVGPAFFGERHEQRARELGERHARIARGDRLARTRSSAPCRACRSRRCACCFVAASALSAPGSTAPITGTRVAATSAGSAFADAVLHAISTSFTPRSSRNCWHAERVLLDGARALTSIRNARGVAEVNDVLAGQRAAKRTNDGEAADARVEDADRMTTGVNVVDS